MPGRREHSDVGRLVGVMAAAAMVPPQHPLLAASEIREGLGHASDGVPAPLIDVLHRLLWLVDNAPAELPEFIRKSEVNLEQLRLVAQSLCGPARNASGHSDPDVLLRRSQEGRRRRRRPAASRYYRGGADDRVRWSGPG